MKLDLFQMQQCWIQARVFERANKAGYDMAAFAEAFMNSSAAEGLDADYDRMQWAGEAYVLESVVNGAKLAPDSAAPKFDSEALFWAGFIYRFWSFKTGESSRAIHARFPLADVLSVYPGFHTISNDRAVEEMIAIAERRAA